MTPVHTLYIIGPLSGPPFKLGYAADPDAKPRLYAHEQPDYNLRLIYAAYYPSGDAAKRAVAELRYRLRPYRYAGGWYYAPRDAALTAASVAGEIEGATEAWAIIEGTALKEIPLLWHKNRVGMVG